MLVFFFLYCRLLWWMSGGYPLLPLLSELLNLGSDRSSSVHIKEFDVLFRTKIEAVPECFWIRRASTSICRVSSEPT